MFKSDSALAYWWPGPGHQKYSETRVSVHSLILYVYTLFILYNQILNISDDHTYTYTYSWKYRTMYSCTSIYIKYNAEEALDKDKKWEDTSPCNPGNLNGGDKSQPSGVISLCSCWSTVIHMMVISGSHQERSLTNNPQSTIWPTIIRQPVELFYWFWNCLPVGLWRPSIWRVGNTVAFLATKGTKGQMAVTRLGTLGQVAVQR